MASFAAKRHAIRAALRHAIVEFAFVGILMARSAGHVVPTEGKELVGPAGGSHLVTIVASNGSMRADKRVTRLAVHGNRISGNVKIPNGVTVFAAVLVGSGGELVVVGVFVAVGAELKLDLVNGVFASRQMAFLAFYGNVFSFERISRSIVFFDPKQRGLPAINGVAF